MLNRIKTGHARRVSSAFELPSARRQFLINGLERANACITDNSAIEKGKAGHIESRLACFSFAVIARMGNASR